MSDTLVTYAECENCGRIIPQGGEIHTASKQTYDTSLQSWVDEYRHLCCRCYRYVGGKCEDVGTVGDPRLPIGENR